jgi:hypothetical protein
MTMRRNHTTPRLTPRCPRCTGRLERFEQQLYCPDCTVYDVPPLRLLTARTADGHFVHAGPDLVALADWVAGVLDPGQGDVVISDQSGRVLAVVRDDGGVIRLR